ncbi:Uma2 family endonuclease [Streptomyces sp. NPDC020412]|uniref:Uma2 family endonuclease n=1 Tax=Streptomyces sp. NPDC020412 TaxID=3365073 RepID=UPI00378E70BB
MSRRPDNDPSRSIPRGNHTVDDLFVPDLPSHTQLLDGQLVFPVPQSVFHSVALFLLESRLHLSVPAELRVRRQMVVVLGPYDAPEPDAVVIKATARSGPNQDRYRAADVVLAIEVVSPESESRDRDTKPRKYAAAGIPHFWLVEMDPRSKQPVVHTFARDERTGAYVAAGTFRDRLKTAEPFEVDIDLSGFDRM